MAEFADLNISTAASERTAILASGLLSWAGHNLFEVSTAPVTQGVTVASGPDYTIAFRGTGSIAYSGAASGTLNGTGANVLVFVEITATTTTLTCTVSGDVTVARVYRSDLAGMQTNDTADPTYYETGATAYFAPALNHDPATLEALGARIEPVGNNLSLHSNDFTMHATVRANITANDVLSPDGTVNADKLVEDNTLGNTHASQINALAFTSGLDYTFSILAKANERSWIRLDFVTGFATAYANFDLSAVSIGTTVGLINSTVKDWGNGWVLCTITATATSTVSGNVQIKTALSDNAIVYDGDNTSGVNLYEALIEEGLVATSRIPAGSILVTRAKDALQVGPVPSEIELWTDNVTINAGWTDNGDGSFSCDGTQAGNANLTTVPNEDIIIGRSYRVAFTVSNYSAGTVRGIAGSAVGATVAADGPYTADVIATTTNPPQVRGNVSFIGDVDNVTVQKLVPFVGYNQAQVSGKITVTPLADGALRYVNFNDGTANEVIEISQDASNNVILTVTDGGVVQATVDSGVNAVIGTELTISYRSGANDFAISVDANAVVTDTSGTMPTVTESQIGEHCLIDSIVAYNVLLSDAQLVELST